MFYEILDEDNLICISNLTNKVSRLKDDMNSLNSMADHIQDTYIFFPLTIIVGWYGMNFTNMPELASNITQVDGGPGFKCSWF